MLQNLLQSDIIVSEMMRDYVLLLRHLTTIVSFYMAILVGRRIKEVGTISATTGMTFYLIGNGLFQWAVTNLLFYEEWEFSSKSMNLTSLIYFFAMGFFSIFAEIEEQREFPGSSLGKGTFRWTKVSVFGMIIFSLIGFIDMNLINLGFIYMVFPFMGTIGTFMDRFSKLEILRTNKPGNYFVIGLSISGFSNFMFSMMFDKMIIAIIQSIMVIVGTLFLVKGWSLIPPMSELKWYLKLNQLLVIQRQGSCVLFGYRFLHSDTKKTLEPGNIEMEGDDILTGGALSGIQSLLGEILKSQQGINEIDHGDKTIYFDHRDQATFVLFTSGKANEFSERLTKFARLFDQKYGAKLTNWDGNLNVFADANQIIKEVFIK